MSFIPSSFKDACEYLVCYLVRTAYDFPAGRVRPADQAVPVGTTEYATVRILTSDSDFGRSNKQYVDDTAQGSTKVKETVEKLYTFTVSIQFFRHATPANDGAGLPVYGLGAFDKASRLANRLSQEDMMALQGEMNLGLARVSSARNVSALVNSSYYEDRGQVDLTFTTPNAETLLLNSIAQATVDLQLAQPGQQHPDHRTITASEVTP